MTKLRNIIYLGCEKVFKIFEKSLLLMEIYGKNLWKMVKMYEKICFL